MRSCRDCGSDVATKTSIPLCEPCKLARKRARAKAYKQTEAYKAKARERAHRAEVRQRNLEAKAKYRQTDKYRETERARESRPEVREYRRQFSASERGRANQRRYAATAKGKATAARALARYRKSDKGRQRARVRDWSRYAKRRGATVTDRLTVEQWREILARHKNKCHYCGVTSDCLTVDHVIPLSKGGSHTAENIVPACQSCNSRKKDHLWRLV